MQSQVTDVQSVFHSVQQQVVVICTKCGRKIEKDVEDSFMIVEEQEYVIGDEGQSWQNYPVGRRSELFTRRVLHSLSDHLDSCNIFKVITEIAELGNGVIIVEVILDPIWIF